MEVYYRSDGTVGGVCNVVSPSAGGAAGDDEKEAVSDIVTSLRLMMYATEKPILDEKEAEWIKVPINLQDKS